MTRWIWAVLASIFLVTNAQGAEEVLLEGVSYELTGSGFQLKLDFDRPYPAKKASVELINHTVQINLPNGYFDSGKSLQKVKDKRIKSVFTYQAKRNLLRSRIIYRANHREKLSQRATLFLLRYLIQVWRRLQRLPVESYQQFPL